MTGVTGQRVFVNQQLSAVSNIITPAGYYSNTSAYNYLYPLTAAKVDAEGISFYFDQNQQFSTTTGGTGTSIYDSGDAQLGFIDSSNPDTNAIGTSFQLSQTPFPASSCPTTLAAPPAPVTATGVPPVVLYMADCPPQVGTVQPGASTGGQCTLNANALGIDIVATGVTSPFVVNTVAPNGATALCTSPTLNDTNPLNVQLIQCFPSSDFGQLQQWVGVQLNTLTGHSNTFPGLMFNTSVTAARGVFPPAIYTVTSASCAAAPLVAQQLYGSTA